MKTLLIVPSYWTRRESEGSRPGDIVFDHPTCLDQEGTLDWLLKSTGVLYDKDFSLVVIGVPTGQETALESAVDRVIMPRLKAVPAEFETAYFGAAQMRHVHDILSRNRLEEFEHLVSFSGYPGIRNTGLLLACAFEADLAVFIDDDQMFNDPAFLSKIRENLGQDVDGERVQAVCGYYTYNGEYLLKPRKHSWNRLWDKTDSMNRAFVQTITGPPRLKKTPFAFGGCMALHRDLFHKVPFDPKITRGEDIDYLINAKLFSTNFYLDNKLSMEHDPPDNTNQLWRQVREDALRFTYERKKLKSRPDVLRQLRPYPAEFLGDDLSERIKETCTLLAEDYEQEGREQERRECLKTIRLCWMLDSSSEQVLEDYRVLKSKWEQLTACLEGPISSQIREIVFD